MALQHGSTCLVMATAWLNDVRAAVDAVTMKLRRRLMFILDVIVLIGYSIKVALRCSCDNHWLKPPLPSLCSAAILASKTMRSAPSAHLEMPSLPLVARHGTL